MNKYIKKFHNIDRWRLNSFFAKFLWPRNKQCSICGKKFHNYTIHGYSNGLSKMHSTSMGERLGDCPYCKISDKHRALYRYLIDEEKIPDKNNL